MRVTDDNGRLLTSALPYVNVTLIGSLRYRKQFKELHELFTTKRYTPTMTRSVDEVTDSADAAALRKEARERIEAAGIVVVVFGEGYDQYMGENTLDEWCYAMALEKYILYARKSPEDGEYHFCHYWTSIDNSSGKEIILPHSWYLVPTETNNKTDKIYTLSGGDQSLAMNIMMYRCIIHRQVFFSYPPIISRTIYTNNSSTGFTSDELSKMRGDKSLTDILYYIKHYKSRGDDVLIPLNEMPVVMYMQETNKNGMDDDSQAINHYGQHVYLPRGVKHSIYVISNWNSTDIDHLFMADDVVMEDFVYSPDILNRVHTRTGKINGFTGNILDAAVYGVDSFEHGIYEFIDNMPCFNIKSMSLNM